MHANCNRIKSDNVCAIIVMKLSEFVRLVRLSEIVGHEKESRTGQSDSRTVENVRQKSDSDTSPNVLHVYSMKKGPTFWGPDFVVLGF